MGRELGINRIDFLKDGTAVIRHSDYNLCGRTDFTGDITSLFYEPEPSVCYLILVDYSDNDVLTKVDKVHVTVEDDYWDEKEFDIEYSTVHRDRVFEICKKHIDEDLKELEREKSILEDAREARRNTTTIKDFIDFSDFIDKLQEHCDEYNEEAKGYWNEIEKIEKTFGGSKARGIAEDASEDVAQSWILLTYSE